MKRIFKNTLWFMLFAFTLSSCELQNELFEKVTEVKNAGTLELNLSSVYKPNNTRSGAVDNGTNTGEFPEADVNVDNYTLIITNKETSEQVVNATVSDLKDSNGKIRLSLAAGNYTVKAYNYDGSNVTVSERPYFLGEKEIAVVAGVISDASLICKLACIETSVRLSSSFLTAFREDYSIIVDNGDGASQVFDQTNLSKKYYFKVPENGKSLNVSVKANSLEGNFVELIATVQKPADAENEIPNLAGGDSFEITITDEGATGSFISEIGIEVDLTFTEDGETITIPVDNIVYNPVEDPEPPTPGEGTLTVTGLPKTYTLDLSDLMTGTAEMPAVVVNMASENGIKTLKVKIASDNPVFPGLLEGLDLAEEFDLCNLEDRPTAKAELLNLGLITEEDYAGLHAGTVTEYTFDVTSLVALLPEQGLFGEHVFTLTISDGNDTVTEALTVNVVE